MTERFGRNKRRRAREALAVEKAKVAVAVERCSELTFQLTVAKNVADGREEMLRRVQAELRDITESVREAFGNASVLAKPGFETTRAVDPPDYYQMQRPAKLLGGPIGPGDFESVTERISATIDMCHVLSVDLVDDHWARSQHVYIVDRRDRVLAYVIPERTIRDMPKAKAVRDLANMLAIPLAEKLRGTKR